MNKRELLFAVAAAFIVLAVSGASAQSTLFLNEAFSRGTDADPDWVELYNHSGATVDVGGYMVYDNGGQSGSKPKKTLPAGTTIAPWGFLVIVTDKTNDPADFGLGSGGDKVWLETPAGAVIDSSVFGAMQETESWQRIPDGGPWKMSSPLTRGVTNVVVKLNEAFSRGTDAEPDWVELYNNCADTIDISGYLVYDNGGQSGSKPKKAVPAGTLLLPHDYLVITTDKTGAESDFGLGSGGDKVWLEDSTGTLVDSVEFGALTETQSYSRIPDGGLWQITETVTKGAANIGSTDVAADPEVVKEFHLGQNYPNPFNPSTQISFTLPHAADVQIAVYNLAGQKVAELANGRMSEGLHQLTFDARALPSGVYLLTIESAVFSASKRMVLMK